MTARRIPLSSCPGNMPLRSSRCWRCSTRSVPAGGKGRRPRTGCAGLLADPLRGRACLSRLSTAPFPGAEGGSTAVRLIRYDGHHVGPGFLCDLQREGAAPVEWLTEQLSQDAERSSLRPGDGHEIPGGYKDLLRSGAGADTLALRGMPSAALDCSVSGSQGGRSTARVEIEYVACPRGGLVPDRTGGAKT
jgi:hypothetical protein